jgi:translation initiation factor 2 beta subunit (eIF-2beta)/eIF-5
MAENKATKGTKIEAPEAAKLDMTKRGVLMTGKEPEVQGQFLSVRYVECPWCGSIGRAVIDSERYHYYTCGACGNDVRA